MNPEQYKHFDYDKAQKDFHEINARYFRAIYFCLAPLLCVPMYQQVRPLHEIYGRNMKQHSAFWEHEALANFWGQDKFMHPRCATDCILKTSQKKNSEDGSIITVYAHGYKINRRVTYSSQWGGDGRMHRVQFIGMSIYQLPVPVTYKWKKTIKSMTTLSHTVNALPTFIVYLIKIILMCIEEE